MKNILKKIITLILFSITLFNTSFACKEKSEYIDCAKHGKHVAVLHLTHPDILNDKKLKGEEVLQRLKQTIKDMGQCGKVTAIIVNTQYNIFNCYSGSENITLGYYLNKASKNKPVKIYLYDCNIRAYLLGLRSETEIHFNQFSYMQLYNLKRQLRTQDNLLEKLKIKSNHVITGSHKAPYLEPFKDDNKEKILDKIITCHQYMSELIKKYRPQAILKGLENKMVIYADELLEKKLVDYITPNIYIYAEQIKKETKADKVVVYNQIKPKKTEDLRSSLWNKIFSSKNTPEEQLLKVSKLDSILNTDNTINPEIII